MLEPRAWMHMQGEYSEPSIRQLDLFEIAKGWKQEPLFTLPDLLAALRNPSDEMLDAMVATASECSMCIRPQYTPLDAWEAMLSAFERQEGEK